MGQYRAVRAAGTGGFRTKRVPRPPGPAPSRPGRGPHPAGGGRRRAGPGPSPSHLHLPPKQGAAPAGATAQKGRQHSHGRRAERRRQGHRPVRAAGAPPRPSASRRWPGARRRPRSSPPPIAASARGARGDWPAARGGRGSRPPSPLAPPAAGLARTCKLQGAGRASWEPRQTLTTLLVSDTQLFKFFICCRESGR